jgi:hypothetical protein
MALRTFQGLEFDSYLLFGFQATNVSFGLVVGKRDTFNKSKGQPLVPMVEQVMEQVSSLRVLGLAPLALPGWSSIIVCKSADMPEFQLPGLPVCQYNCGLLTVSTKFQYKLVHLSGQLSVFFRQISQFPKQEGTTQSMLVLLETEVRFPAVVHGQVLKIL